MHSYKRNLQEFLCCKVDRVSSWCSEGCRFKPSGEPETSFSHARDEVFITFFTLIVFVLKEPKLTQSYFYLSIYFNRRPCMFCRFPNKRQATWRSHHHFAPQKTGFFYVGSDHLELIHQEENAGAFNTAQKKTFLLRKYTYSGAL